MNLLIRQALIEDVDRIRDLSFQLGYSLSEQEIAYNIQYLSDNDVVFVAEQNDIVIGWMQIAYIIRIESLPFCEVVGLVVDEAMRSKKVGSKLLSKAREWASIKHCIKLRVRSNVKRHDAHGFYLSAGFKETKEQKVFDLEL